MRAAIKSSVFLLLFCSAPVPGATPDSPIVLDDTRAAYTLEDALAYGVDKTGQLGLDDVHRLDFRVRQGGPPNFGYTQSAVWLRFRVENRTADSAWLLEIDNPTITSAKIWWIGPDTSSVPMDLGTYLPFGSRPIPHQNFVIPVDLRPGESRTCLIRLASNEPLRFKLHLSTETTFFLADQNTQFYLGAFYGLFGIFVLHNLFLFLSIADRTHLYLALFALFGGISLMLLDGTAFKYLWPAAPRWNQESRAVFNVLFIFATIKFTTAFIGIERISAVWRSIFFVSMYFCLLMLALKAIYLMLDHGDARSVAVAAFGAGALGLAAMRRIPGFWAGFGTRAGLASTLSAFVGLYFLSVFAFGMEAIYLLDRTLNMGLPLVTVAGVGTAGVAAWRAGYRPAIYFLMGTSGFVVGATVITLLQLGVLPLHFLTANGVKICTALSLPLLSFALGNRINTLQAQVESERLRVADTRQRAALSRLEALRAKINPHFLFNVLNSIANLVSESPQRAETAIEKLSALFRYTLNKSEDQLVTLDEELRIVQSYLDLESYRFEDRMSYQIEIDPACRSVRIPALTLQPLVENSVKHGIAGSAEGGVISLKVTKEADTCLILLRDSGSSNGAAERRGAGHALSNIAERLELTFGESGKLTIRTDNGTLVKLEIPMQQDSGS